MSIEARIGVSEDGGCSSIYRPLFSSGYGVEEFRLNKVLQKHRLHFPLLSVFQSSSAVDRILDPPDETTIDNGKREGSALMFSDRLPGLSCSLRASWCCSDILFVRSLPTLSRSHVTWKCAAKCIKAWYGRVRRSSRSFALRCTLSAGFG
ncbi:uncharacterized protein BDR25DRAFT_108980 [Lindgomyces ingoldianus]|uniref:Uncharacterized protein n=1 Tax=Lindgomyces ingoldianus TaxID=673940 RepID=A0ACB6QAU6_9PLEO|nr:uncharacterized protein BDR25DRAFT_108980 [Lindgomyces ingoldianus]KAF2463497.1 hypothetical protein BDR25DRAFT_108980 [Lindgomyces ingoldianus]